MGILEEYDTFIYCKELRNNDGELIMFTNCSFDTIKKDSQLGCIILSNSYTDDICMLSSQLHIADIIHIDRNKDQIILSDGSTCINVFCKKN